MPEDPRGRNQQFDLVSIEGHVRGYAEVLSKALLSVDWQQLNHVITEIEAARIRGARLWIAGNGGSAAIADHLLCDWVKGTYTPEQPPIHVHSLVANVPLLTAIANDFSYEIGFSRQLEMQARHGDVLISISSSGNSPNILAVMNQARAMKMMTIAFTGFTGGEAAKLADISIHVAADNYGVVEDCHQALMHNIAQYIYGRGPRRSETRHHAARADSETRHLLRAADQKNAPDW